MKCFYHNADLDGKCSAAIVKYMHADIDLIGIDYGDLFPWDSLIPGEIVYMVDFSLQPFKEMIKLADIVDLIWIDHHKTAIEEMQKSGHNIGRCVPLGVPHMKPTFKGLQKVGIGACDLVWEWFLFSKRNFCVHLLAEYDVWNHSDPQCLPFQYGMRELDTEPNSDVWNKVIRDEPAFIAEVIQRGELILKYEDRQNKERAKALSFETELDGLKVIAMNGWGNSKLFDFVWNPNKYDAMLTFVWKKGRWKISLYTDKFGINVGAIAKARGGGGHFGAAGFHCKNLPEGLLK